MELLREASKGDKAATEALVRDNIGLVRSVALRFKDRGVDYDDLVQIGSLGMLKAIRSFDLSLGTSFSTYAVPLIMGEIRRFLRDDGLIKVSRQYKQNGAMLMREREKYILEFGEEPKIEVLAKNCGLTIEDAVVAIDATATVSSLHASIDGDDENFTLEKSG